MNWHKSDVNLNYKDKPIVTHADAKSQILIYKNNESPATWLQTIPTQKMWTFWSLVQQIQRTHKHKFVITNSPEPPLT